MNPNHSLARLALGITAVACLAPAALAGPACQSLDECPCVFEMVESTIGRGWVGISMNYDGTRYVVSEVVPKGPAARAGLKIGDRLVAMNGVPMSRGFEEKLAAIYRGMIPDSDLTYTLNRDGKDLDVTVRLGHLPEKILALVLGQQLLESYEKTTGKPLPLPKPPPQPKPPEPPKGAERGTPTGG